MEMFRANLSKTLEPRRRAFISKRFKMGRPRADVDMPKPERSLYPQRDIEKKVTLEHKFYGKGDEMQKNAMVIAKMKALRENIKRQQLDTDFKPVRRSRIDEFNTSPCDNVF
jgi:hypothetical protein